MTSLALALTDLERLHHRVAALAENRPAVYRMLDATGRVIYVGKAKFLRKRLLSYFRARYPKEKAARILNATTDIAWDPMPSEFAALLGELRQIRRFRPVFNVQMNRSRRVAFIKVSSGVAPKVYVASAPGPEAVRHYGPFPSTTRLKESVRVLNDLLGLRDCALERPITFSGQGDLFGPTRRAACIRYEIGRCSGPCGGLVSQREYANRVAAAIDFLEASSIAPIERVIAEMTAASERNEFERAVRWREKFDRLEWLLAAVVRARSATDALSFVYSDPGAHGDDRVYIIRRATVRASAPAPHTPIEREAFRALVAKHAAFESRTGTLPAAKIDEILLLTRWFRRYPHALRRTVPLTHWIERSSYERQ
ncbi:MAG: nuclease [Gemmatimonadales bacterium]